MGIIKKVTDVIGEDGMNLAKQIAGQKIQDAVSGPESAPPPPAGQAVDASTPPPPPAGQAVDASTPPPPPASAPLSSTTSTGSLSNPDVVDQLQKLSEMYKSGLLNEAEFTQAKNRLLA